MSPKYSPVREPARDSGGMPACSSASHVTSHSKRCWGSTQAASWALMPKNSGSYAYTSPSRKQPHRIRSATAGGRTASSAWDHRAAGTSPTVSRPANSNSSSASRE